MIFLEQILQIKVPKIEVWQYKSGHDYMTQFFGLINTTHIFELEY